MNPLSGRRNDIRCQLCGIGSNIGRLRTKDEPAEAGWLANKQAAPPSNGVDCDGCFVGKIYDFDDEDAGDTTYFPDNEVEDDADRKWEFLKLNQSGDGYDDEPAAVEAANDADMSDHSELYQSFLERESDGPAEIHALTEEYKQKDENWADREHIAGPNCKLTNGYSGHRITVEEMRGSRTFQLLCPKREGWKPTPGDEEFEKDSSLRYYLSGLADGIDSKHPWNNMFVPVRHGQVKHRVCNWASAAGDATQAAMPFHPACFEVYKRASMHRYGKIDVGGLTDWYRVESTWHFTDKIFPHDEAVKRGFKGKGSNKTWSHVEGDEWVVANPCFVPALTAMDVTTEEPFVMKRQRGEDVNLANLSLAPNDANVSLSQYYEQILEEMPWLWEAWCTLPYSGWATTSQSQLQENPLDKQHEREYLQHLIGYMTADSVLTAEQSEDLERIQQRLEQLDKEEPTCPTGVDAPQLPRDGIDWRKLYNFLKDSIETSHGLRNRQRIWKNCNYIMGRIELQRAKGKIGPGSQLEREGPVATLAPTASGLNACPHVYVGGLNFTDDYSEDEAEFSDSQMEDDSEADDSFIEGSDGEDDEEDEDMEMGQ
ncbi:hypothetical protein K4F52_006497 [Lecanicillium sp. MT-2017a]|nr:hypothetical protein K4F52_006497 [Lecanicillium sp. MT-2017a]